MADIPIKGGILITMNPKREVIEDRTVAIEGQRIIDLGSTDEVAPKHQAGKVIDARHKAVLPGLVKTMGSSQPHLWKQMYGKIHTEGSGEEFWHAEARLSALERLKCGTTCGVSYLGGGDNYMRSDEPVYGERHCQAVE
jgi:cytosine/adenosine deaminase-related metal-dependent hydrolase